MKSKITMHPDYYSEHEIRHILDCAREEGTLAYSIVHFMYASGFRLKEICELRVNDVDFENEVVYARNVRTMRSRSVPLIVSSVIRDYLAGRSARMPKTDRFFITDDTKAITGNIVRSLFKSIGKKAGIKISCSKLRHSVAMHLYTHGAQMEFIRAVLVGGQSRLIKWSLPLAADQLRNCMNKCHPLAQSQFTDLVVNNG